MREVGCASSTTSGTLAIRLDYWPVAERGLPYFPPPPSPGASEPWEEERYHLPLVQPLEAPREEAGGSSGGAASYKLSDAARARVRALLRKFAL